MTSRTLAAAVLALAILAPPLTADAQPPGKVARIGYLLVSPLALTPTAERQAFLDGLRELGWEEGRNLRIEYRAANWNRELLPDLADELVALKVDVIVAFAGAIDAARQATKTIPIVMPAMGDPVELGLVTSLARPGGNITGTAWNTKSLAGKRLEMLKEALPKLSRVAVLWNAASLASLPYWKETEAAAPLLGLALQSVEVKDPKDFPDAFAAITRRRPQALMVMASSLTSAYRPIIVEFALKNRIPTMFDVKADVEAGGLMAYGPHVPLLFRRAAVYVDRILKGTKPGDLPIEQPDRFELVINLKTAKALGLKIPPSVLIRAEYLIQ